MEIPTVDLFLLTAALGYYRNIHPAEGDDIQDLPGSDKGRNLSTPFVDNRAKAVDNSPDSNVSSRTLANCTQDRQAR
jgi:hypothetical protein